MDVDVDAVRERLLRERGDVQREIDNRKADLGRSLEDETDEDGLDSHLGDSATETFERELDVTRLDNATDLLAHYDRALERLDAGSYGTCEACGRSIEPERLEVLAYATLCIDDARKLERRG